MVILAILKNGDGEATTGSTVRVSGSPDDVYNGDYQLTELSTSDGGPVYKHINNEAYIYLLQGFWFIYTDYSSFPGSYYYTGDASSTIPVTSAWMNLDGHVIDGMKSEVVSNAGSGDDRTYVYTVSGAGTAGVDGNYYDTGETTKGPTGNDLGYHIYTNGTAKIEFMIDYSSWSISLDDSQKYYIVWDDEAMTTGTTVTVFGEDPAPTISTFVHSGGGSASESTNPDSGDETLSEEEKIETLMSQQTIAENSVTSIANDANIITEKLNDITLLSETLTEIIG